MKMIFESELVEEITEAFKELSPVEFVEEYNRMFGTNLITSDILWGDKISCENCRKCGETTCGNDTENLKCFEEKRE